MNHIDQAILTLIHAGYTVGGGGQRQTTPVQLPAAQTATAKRAAAPEPAKPASAARVPTCRTCGEPGHYSPTCPAKPAAQAKQATSKPASAKPATPPATPSADPFAGFSFSFDDAPPIVTGSPLASEEADALALFIAE